MIWEVKEWAELSANEVENIFSLRSEVFVVEQDCVYQDIDGKDQKANHVLGKKNNEIVAYAKNF
jgi:Predicted acyltransferase